MKARHFLFLAYQTIAKGPQPNILGAIAFYGYKIVTSYSVNEIFNTLEFKIIVSI